MNRHSDIFNHFADAPENEIDPIITPRFRVLAESEDPKASELHDILDDCANSGLASDFAMQAIDILWQVMLIEEGLTPEEAVKAKHGPGDAS